MEQEPEFPQIGKRMNYKVPEGFFENITEKTLAEAHRRERIRNKNLVIRRFAGMAAMWALIIFTGFWLINRINLPYRIASQSGKETPVNQPSLQSPTPAGRIDSAIQSPDTMTLPDSPDLNLWGEEPLEFVLAALSDEELLLLAAQSEADIFIDGNNNRQR